jgi:hypothetical protein
MKSKAFALIGFLAVLAAGCAGPGPGLTGNDVGGIIPWSPDNQRIAPDWAEQHCARYGKHARITSVYAQPGNYIAFACVFGRVPIQRDKQIILRSLG